MLFEIDFGTSVMILKPSEVFYIVVGYLTLIQSIVTILQTMLLSILQLVLEINDTLMNYTISFQVEPKN